MAWVFTGEGCRTVKKSSYKISTRTNLKSNCGLDGWLNRYEHLLLFQRTWVWFPAPTLMAHTHLGFQFHGIGQPSRMYIEGTSLFVWNVHRRKSDGIGRFRVAQGCCRWVWSFLKVTEWCRVSLWPFYTILWIYQNTNYTLNSYFLVFQHVPNILQFNSSRFIFR